MLKLFKNARLLTKQTNFFNSKVIKTVDGHKVKF